MIIVDSHIGYGAPHKQDTSGLTVNPWVRTIRLAKRKYGWPEDKKFHVPKACTNISVKRSGNGASSCAMPGSHKLVNIANSTPNWQKNYSACNTVSFRNIGTTLPEIPADSKGLATRESSAKVLNAFAKNVPWLIGGSADLRRLRKPG